MPEVRTLMTGLVFGESPRWHGDRLWLSDMGAGEVIAVDRAGQSEVVARVPTGLSGIAISSTTLPLLFEAWEPVAPFVRRKLDIRLRQDDAMVSLLATTLRFDVGRLRVTTQPA